MIEIAPSILSADFSRLADALQLAGEGGAGAVHVDVMDGQFVPNLTIGPPVVRSLAKATELPLDCHLMIERPERFVAAFADAGAARITVHVEACVHLHRTMGLIREHGAQVGVALNPATPLAALEEALSLADQLLVMSVNPGFSGQSFIPEAIGRVERLAATISERNARALVQVDGGVGPANIAALAKAGARSFVAGNAVYASTDPRAAIRKLKAAAEAAL